VLAIAGFALRYENRITTVENATAELYRKQDKVDAKMDAGDVKIAELQKTDVEMDQRIVAVTGRFDNFRLEVGTSSARSRPPSVTASHDQLRSPGFARAARPARGRVPWAYQDPLGFWTIGVGHLGGPH
jgi:hypothetical protein